MSRAIHSHIADLDSTPSLGVYKSQLIDHPSAVRRSKMLSIHQPTRSAAIPPTDALALQQLLTDLYHQQLQLTPDDLYLKAHAKPGGVRHHVRNFLWYKQFLPRTGAILDWGCNHAPDSVLLRACFSEQYELHGCDFRPPDSYEVFHDYADLAFAPLQHVCDLPYTAESFDVVIGSGTLEHTAMPAESLKRLYHLLRPDGLLIITYLPNRWSIQELIKRTRKQDGFHQRLYGLGQASRLLKDHGFMPLVGEYQSDIWDGVGARWSRVLKWCVPLQIFTSTLRFAARKVMSM
jgi:SAM-dependent methyltransferase